jgi:hypothetical protein
MSASEIRLYVESESPTARGGRTRSRYRLRFQLGSREWIIREGGQRHDTQPLSRLEGMAGTSQFRFDLHPEIVEACLRHAPQAVRLNELDPADAALLAEHCLSPLVTKLEALLGEPVHFLSLGQPEKSALRPRLAFGVDLGEGSREALFSTEDSRLLARIEDRLDGLEARGPEGHPGLAVRIGPIYLSALDSALQAGEQLSLVEGETDTLAGMVMLDDQEGWPARLHRDSVEIIGAFRSGDAHRAPPTLRTLYLDWGRTLEGGDFAPGSRIPYSVLEGEQVMLLERQKRVAHAALVKIATGLVLEIVKPDPDA